MILVADTRRVCNRADSFKKAIVILLSLFFVACSESPAPHFTLSGATMGTTYHLTVLEQEGVSLSPAELQQAVDAQLQTINQQMSTYIDDSELNTLNRAPVGEVVAMSPNLFEVLLLSFEVSLLSDGAFDITVGPLVKLWGFGPGRESMTDAVPDADTIKAMLLDTGFDNLEFDLLNATVTKKAAISMDLSGVAKGFAVDKVAGLLEYAGYRNYMVEIGGELRLRGLSPRGTPWRIAIEEPDPSGLRAVHRAVEISDKGMATSGDYRNFFEVDGQRFSHTIDPATGYPITHNLASVTVIADSAAFADAMATALDVMGPDKALALAEQQGLAVYLIVKTEQGFVSRYSTAFSEQYQGDDDSGRGT